MVRALALTQGERQPPQTALAIATTSEPKHLVHHDDFLSLGERNTSFCSCTVDFITVHIEAPSACAIFLSWTPVPRSGFLAGCVTPRSIDFDTNSFQPLPFSTTTTVASTLFPSSRHAAVTNSTRLRAPTLSPLLSDSYHLATRLFSRDICNTFGRWRRNRRHTSPSKKLRLLFCA